EFGQLAESFNTMASEVQSAIQTVENRSRFLQSTVEVGTLVTRINQQAELLPAVTDYIQSQFDLYYTQIYLLDETKRYALLRAGTGDVGEQLLARKHQLDTDGRSLVATAVQTRQAVLVTDTAQSDIHRANELLPDTRSEVTIPLIISGEVLGVLDMQDTVAGRFNQDNLSVFEAMANQLASGLASTNAYDEIGKAIERAEQLNERVTKRNWRNYLGSMSDGQAVQVQFDAYGDNTLKLINDDVTLHDIASYLEDQHSLKQTIKLGQQDIGQIVIREDAERLWTSDERNLIQGAAQQLAQAAEQFRAFDETEAARQRSASLYDVSQRLSEANSMEDILNTLVKMDVAKGLFSAWAMVYEHGEAGQADWADVVGVVGDDSLRVDTRFFLPEFPLTRLFINKNSRPVLIGDVHTSQHIDQHSLELFEQTHISSIVILPLKRGHEDLGVITLNWQNQQQFTEGQQDFFRAILTPIATTMNNLMLLDQTQRRAVEMETVTRVSTTVSSQLNLDVLLQSVSDLTRQQFDLYHTHIYLLDAEAQQLVLSGGAGAVGQRMIAAKHRIPQQSKNSIVAKAARERQGVIVDDVTLSPDFLPNPLLPQTRSEIAVPLIAGDKVIGVLDAQSRKVARFEKNDIQVFAALASQVAVAVENARAFEREQQTVERLREVDQLKSQFLANMSHELRTPLNSIIGYAGILYDGGEGELPEDALMDIDIIQQSGKHLLSIINDILDLAKIEARELKLRLVPLEISKVLDEVVRSGRVLAEEKGISLEVVEDTSVGLVSSDMVRTRQIIWNLVSNAMKFTEEGGVTVRYGMHNDKELYVRIEDTGMGIPSDQIGQVFERFSQVDGSSTRSAGGTGLGLTITRELIQMHGGEIYAESEVGVGSTFWFTLPIMVSEQATETTN
ncbi:MAG: GAF domain-containing protein, partial [Phototrophicaceae bacterium]